MGLKGDLIGGLILILIILGCIGWFILGHSLFDSLINQSIAGAVVGFTLLFIGWMIATIVIFVIAFVLIAAS